jgi:hypothetical protein
MFLSVELGRDFDVMVTEELEMSSFSKTILVSITITKMGTMTLLMLMMMIVMMMIITILVKMI